MRRNKVSASKDIPQDILLQILYRSPVKSLIRFSCVSKLWFTLINNDPQFNKFHSVESRKKSILIFTFRGGLSGKILYCYNREQPGNTHKLQKYPNMGTLDSLDYGYYNGLVCYRNLPKRGESYDREWVNFSLEICNPSRREKLVVVSRIPLKSKGQLIFGVRFGCDLLSNEYKIMCIMRIKDNDGKHEYEYYIFTLGGTQPWRQINNPWPKQRPSYLYDNHRRILGAISCNGTLFYEVTKDESEEERYKRFALISFDFHGEKFRMIRFPGDDEFVLNYNNNNLYPMEYKGCLCYPCMDRIDPYIEGTIVLHMLTNTLEDLWVKETIDFVLPREFCKPLFDIPEVVSFSNQVILVWRLCNDSIIQFYNVHSQEFREVKLVDECASYGYNYSISNQVENSISLRTLVTTTSEGNARQIWNDYQKNCHLIRDLFNLIPTSNPAVISFLDSF